MKKSPVNRELASPSQPARSAGSVQLSPRDSQDAPRLRRQQLAADQGEVRQREEAAGARQVLGDTAVPHLGEAPQRLTTWNGCSPRARVRDRARLIARQRALSGWCGAAARRFTR